MRKLLRWPFSVGGCFHGCWALHSHLDSHFLE
jgi:hypothetical protein